MPRKKKSTTELSAEKVVETPADQKVSDDNVPNKDRIFTADGELVIDVFETNSDFVVSAAIAGVQIQDIDISVEKDMMVIKGHRPDPHGQGEKKYFYQECYWGPFSRKIVLPENIDTQSADAKMDRGMLTIKIPKITDNKPKAVQIS